MKRTTLLFIVCFLGMQSAFAGGLLTNANQSAQYIRMLSRNASTDLDAVYFNPAGVMELQNGFHFGFHSQTLFQTRTITTTAPLNNQEFIGDLKVPVFPSAFAVYKKDKLAFSLGFGPNAGGGSVVFDDGIPSFEGRIASQVNGQLVPALAGLGAFGYNVESGYDAAIAFEGQSVFWGIQLGMSAEINDVVSVYGGVRVLPSVNTYTGTISNIKLKVNDELTNAEQFLLNASSLVGSYAVSAAEAALGMQSLVEGGAGSYTLAQVEGAGYIDAAKRAEIEQGLMVLGANQDQIDAMPITQVQGTFNSGATSLSATAGELENNSALLQDQELDTKQTGTGFTPILGVNISPSDRLNIGVKYEFQTVLKLTNDTKVDDTGFFPDKAESRTDIPAILMVGVDYQLTPKLVSSVSFNNYFDKGVNWGKTMSGDKRVVDDNLWEISLGLQYDVSDRFALSAGAMQSTTGVSEQYQSDFSYSNSSNSFAAGFQWKATKQLTLDAGVLYTAYEDEDKAFPAYTETYDKENLGIAIGLQYSIFK
ncbi:OmpP1/FadL family transporter [Sunxiuqinia sp. sy24]|uniref:OmpP1/FadL family transporter n=1 Tax=Sunxiuqinia sp. sy24 TaxID=3461495 RepID=UPI00404660D5